MNVSRKLDWRPILLEAFFVVLGVAVALGANEWRQAAANRRDARTALDGVREELATNRRAVLASLQYHGSLTDTLYTLLERARSGGAPSPAPSAGLFPQGFINPAQVLSTAWGAAEATGAVRHMDYAEVLVVAGIYDDQRRYVEQGEMVGGIIYGRLFDQGMGGVLRNYPNVATIVSTFVFRECRLLARYDEVLARLQAPDSARAPAPPPRCARLPRG